MKKLSKSYTTAKQAKVGSAIKCGYCSNVFIKRYYQQVFCCRSCKDAFWNERGDRHVLGKEYYNKYNNQHQQRMFNHEFEKDYLYDSVTDYMVDEECDNCEW